MSSTWEAAMEEPLPARQTLPCGFPGHKELEALKYAEVAAAASVSRQTGKACIFGTTSLVSHCLRKGEDIAFVLKDIGVLLIEGTAVHIKFYYDFLAKISGKENLEKVVFKVSCSFCVAWAVPRAQSCPHTAHQELAGCSGRASAVLLSALPALGSSCPQRLSRDEDVPHPPRSSPAGPLAAGHAGVPGGTGGLPDLLRPSHRLSHVSMLVAAAPASPLADAILPPPHIPSLSCHFILFLTFTWSLSLPSQVYLSPANFT